MVWCMESVFWRVDKFICMDGWHQYRDAWYHYNEALWSVASIACTDFPGWRTLKDLWHLLLTVGSNDLALVFWHCESLWMKFFDQWRFIYQRKWLFKLYILVSTASHDRAVHRHHTVDLFGRAVDWMRSWASAPAVHLHSTNQTTLI